jgi:hypothetical protein
VSVLAPSTPRTPQADAAWDSRHVFLTNLRSVGGRAYPRVFGLLREPSWLFFEIALPFLTMSAFVFVYRAIQAPEDTRLRRPRVAGDGGLC